MTLRDVFIVRPFFVTLEFHWSISPNPNVLIRFISFTLISTILINSCAFYDGQTEHDIVQRYRISYRRGGTRFFCHSLIMYKCNTTQSVKKKKGVPLKELQLLFIFFVLPHNQHIGECFWLTNRNQCNWPCNPNIVYYAKCDLGDLALLSQQTDQSPYCDGYLLSFCWPKLGHVISWASSASAHTHQMCWSQPIEKSLIQSISYLLI